jgi:hypothetical protein
MQRQRWEYETLQVSKGVWAFESTDADPIEELNTLGEEGWELTATIEGNVNGAGGTKTLVFKRPAE